MTSYPCLLLLWGAMLSNNQVSEDWTRPKNKIKACNGIYPCYLFLPFLLYSCHKTGKKKKKHFTFSVLVLYFPERIFEATAASTCKNYFRPVHSKFISRTNLIIVLRCSSVERNLFIPPWNQYANKTITAEIWFLLSYWI